MSKTYCAILFLAFLILCSISRTFATHLMGGNLVYQYIQQVNDSTFRYRIIFKTYTNCGDDSNVPFPEAQVTLGIYTETANPNDNKSLYATITINLTDTALIEPQLPDTCTVGSGVCIIEGTYIDEIDLPLNFFGYHLYYNRCCRNGDILNLLNPGDKGMVFHAFIPPTLIENSSPVFADLPIPFLCVGDTQSIINTAFDPDGDQLIFSFVDPYENGSYPPYAPAPPAILDWPIPVVPWNSGYNKNQPFGSGGYAYINGATGYSEYLSPDTGKFVVVVEIKEYRNSQLIGITRRDMQLMVIDCPFNPAPDLSSIGGSGQTIYSIEEGDSLCFPITFTDLLGDSLFMNIVSPIFDTALTNPAATITTPVIGDSIVTSNFCWNTACGQGQSLPYLFTVSVRDNGCPPKTADEVYQITVFEFEGPSTITGVNNVCPFTTGVSYSVASVAGATYTWTITGGTQASGGNSTSITVDWDSAGVGVVQMIATSSLGCDDDPVTLNVTINSFPNADAGIDVYFCSGDTAQLGTANTFNYAYSWTPATGLSDTTISNPTVTLTNTGSQPDTNQYIVITTNTFTSCALNDTVLAIVFPQPGSDAGTDVSFCSGDTANIGSTALAGYTYLWSPGTGLSDSTISDPTVSLTNFGSTPDTFYYVVNATDTAPACVANDTVQVIVRPYPIPDAGPDLSFCSGVSDTLGTVPTAGYTYSWLPVSGLSDPALSDPVVTLINADTIIDTIEYVVTTTAFSCSSFDTATVYVHPLPIVDAGSDIYMCSGDSDTLGSASIGGYSYLWSPTTGLSDSTVSDPEVSLTNPLIPNDTTEYTVTVTTGFGCADADSALVIVNHLPGSEAGSDTSFCSGDTVSLGTPTTTGYTYSWSPVTGITDPASSDPQLSLINTDTIIDTVMYYVTTTVDSCSTMDSVEVIVHPLPIVDAGPDIYMCSGDTDTLGSASVGGYSYLWTPTTGLSDSTVADPEVTLTNPLIPNDTTEYIVTVTTGFGCVDADSAIVIVNHLPISEAGSDVSFCSGDTSAIGTANTVGYVYAWSPGTGLSDSIISDPTITLINTDTIIDTIMYYVTTTVDSCSTMDSVEVIVHPLPIVDAGLDIYMCSGDADTLGSASIGGYSYLWTPTTGLSDSIVADPEVSLTNPLIPNDTTEYIVTVTTGFGCVDADSALVIINHLPTSEAGPNVTFCSGDGDSLGTTNTAGYAYLWTPIAGLSDSSVANPAITLINTDTVADTIMYYVTTTVDSCNTTDSVQIIVLPLSISNAGNDTSFCSGDTVSIGTAPTINYVYSWSPDTGLSDSTLANPTVTLINNGSTADTIIYVVTTTDTTTSCISSDTVEVVVRPLPITPEIFGSISVCPGVDSVDYFVVADSGSTFLWSLTGNGTIISGQGTDSILVNWDSTILWTITTIETNVFGCVGDTSVLNGKTNVILEPPIPIGPDTICTDSLLGINYQVIYTNGSVYDWYIIGGTIISGAGTNSVIVNWDSTGMIWYEETSVTIDTVCTGVSDTLAVTVYQSPTATIITGDRIVCQTITPTFYSILGLSGSLFTWFLDGDTVANAIGLDTISLVWDSAGTFEVSVLETAIGNCTQLLSDSVLVNPKPQTSSITGDTAICFDSAGSYLYHVTGFAGSTYQWIVNGGTITSTPLNNDSISVTWDSVVTGTVSVIETSTDSCIGDAIIKVVNVFQIPQATTINGGFVFCEDTISNDYSINSLGGSTIIWLLDTDTVAQGVDVDSISLVWDSAGTYVITVIENTINNCPDTLRDTVTVYPKPVTSSIIGDTAICFDSADTFIYFVTGFTGSAYQWNVTGGTIVSTPLNDDSITVQWDSVVTGIITVVETSADSCDGDTISVSVNVYQVPQETAINGAFVFCEDSVGYEYSIASLPGSDITWVLNGDTIAAGIDMDTITLVWDSAETFFLTVVEVTDNGCPDTLNSIIIVHPKPQTIGIFGDTAICYIPSDTGMYHVVGFGGSVYQWTVTGGTIVSDSSQWTNDTLLISWDSLGTGMITVVETSQDSCSGDTLSLTVEINEIPWADSLIGIFDMCQFSASLTYSLLGFDSSTYIWSLPGATVLVDDSSNTVVVNWDSAGTFTMSVVEISDKGCVGDTVDTTIVIYPYPQTALLSGDTNICPPNNLSQMYTVLGYDSSTFFWTVIDGNITGGQGNDTIFIDWLTDGMGSVSVVEITKDSCIGDTIGWFSILLDSPGIELRVVSDGEQNDLEVEVEWDMINSIGFPDSVLISKKKHFTTDPWAPLVTVLASDQIYIDQAVSTHSYSYEYQISGLNACLKTVSSVVHNNILLNGSMDESANTINLQWNKYNGWKQGIDHYEVWRKLDDDVNYSFYYDNDLDTSVQFSSGKDGFHHCFRVIGYESSGNSEDSWSNELCVDFKHLLHIPNVITPNGNGWNDTWKIENIEFYPDVLVAVFNRWGMQVFESTGYPVNWDGTYKERDLPVGVYYYVIDIKVEGVEVYTGSVSILHRE